MSNEASSSSSRRILSRNKPTDEEHTVSSRQHQSKSDLNKSSSSIKNPIKETNKENVEDTSMSVPNVHQHSLANNYINKEPFNEDIDIEECSLLDDLNWRNLVIDKFKDLIEDMKSIQKRIISSPSSADKAMFKEKYRRGLMLCSTIKKLNRISHMRVNKARIKTYEEKNKIDEFHLELQNLLYEISHLRMEINKCLEFRSLHEDISLVPLEEFYEKAPAEVSIPEITRNNEHKLKLAQLDWELIERQNMIGRIKELELQIEQHEKQVKLKKDKLESLHPKLNQILAASKPTLEYFNTNFEDSCSFSEQVQFLPKPLYQFYMMISAYRDTIDKEVKVEVCGDLDEAKRFNINETINFEDDDSDSGNDEEVDENYKKKKSKSKINKKKSSNRDKLFGHFPLSCKITFNVKNFGHIILELFYLNILKIVTVKTDLKLLKDISFTDKSDSIFKCLYENDTGTESPNLSNKFLFNNMGVKSIEPYLKQIGKPYRWCQMLCGLYYENKSDRESLIYKSIIKSESSPKLAENDSESDRMMINDSNEEKMKEEQSLANKSSENMEINGNEEGEDGEELTNNESELNESKIFEHIITRLKSRFKARIFLQESINSLKSLTIPNTEAYSVNQIRFRIQSTISSFKESTYEKFSNFNYTKALLNSNLNINENECSFFEINLQNSNASLQAQIVINQNYPLITPVFSININWKHDRNSANDEAVRDMEREINIYRDNITVEEMNGQASSQKLLRRLSLLNKNTRDDARNYDIFARQINHLLVCFDIYLESESYYLNDFEFQRIKLFPNAVRGRDRKRPYSYLAARDLFVQRMQIDSANNND